MDFPAPGRCPVGDVTGAIAELANETVQAKSVRCGVWFVVGELELGRANSNGQSRQPRRNRRRQAAAVTASGVKPSSTSHMGWSAAVGMA